MSSSLHVIVNPASSNGAGGKTQPRLERELTRRGIPFVLERTERAGHGEVLAKRAAENGAQRILAVGGDGTIHEVANGILTAEGGAPALAVLPMGTGNDFYRMVGASRKMTSALDILQAGVTRAFDVGLVEWEGGSRYFINLLGFGIDVAVLQQREGVRRLRGLAQYIAALLKALVHFEAVGLDMTFDDGETLRDRTMLTAVTVGPSVGGGFMVCPEAKPDDGLLDLCFVQELSFLQVLRYIPRVVRGTHANLDVVRLRPLRSAEIRDPDGAGIHFELDGELMPDPVERLFVRVEPGRLPVFVSDGGSE